MLLGLALGPGLLPGGATGRDAVAAELEGISIAGAETIDGRPVTLNGMGVRARYLGAVKVYVAALYLERPSRSAGEIIASEQVKALRIVVLRDVTSRDVTAAIEEAVERAVGPARFQALRPRLDRLRRMVPDLRRGQEIWLTQVPGRGTAVLKGPERTPSGPAPIEGRDFAEDILRVWLGVRPVDEGLKQALVGG